MLISYLFLYQDTPMKRISQLKFSALVAASLTLVACGGGGGAAPTSSADTGTPEGVYGGVFSGGSSNAFQLLVLENNEMWALYGTESASAFLVSGFLQATGIASGGNYSSTAATNFPASGAALNGTVSATYNSTAKTISGTATSLAATPITFSGSPIAGSTYNYNTPAALSNVTGSWSLTDITGDSISLSVGSTGAFTASTGSGCNFSGTVIPRASGKNVFNVSLTFGASPCLLAGQTVNGIAINYPVTGGRNQLVVSVINSSRIVGTAAFGTR